MHRRPHATGTSTMPDKNRQHEQVRPVSGCFASSRSGWQEICAYGTAVKIRPLTDPTALHTTTSA